MLVHAVGGRLAGPRIELEGGGALVDVATPPWHHSALAASLRHSLLPSLRGETVGITSFGIGLHIQ
ncbi:MAG: hypothetical protein ACJ8GN_16440 [Longimicrobiaceae bacterium]